MRHASLAAPYRLAREVGLDLRRLPALLRIPRYLRDLLAWRLAGGRVNALHPCLGDRTDPAGHAASAYFQQDLLVARRIHAANPRRHIDVGSRIDGFIGHLAVFRAVEVIDVRPLTTPITNVAFLQHDLTGEGAADRIGQADSVSSLHALEHFGLGRYGDPLQVDGHLRGFRALASLLEPHGRLYVSFPVGRPSVEFNAHRVFDPEEPLRWIQGAGLRLVDFDYIGPLGDLHEHQALDAATCATLRALPDACGVYTFARN